MAAMRLNLASWRARRQLRGKPPLCILVDNTVLELGVTHETKWVSTGVQMWGNQPFDSGYQARVPVYAKGNQSERFRQVKYLTTICHLARIGAVKLFLSAELQDEQFRQPSGRYTGYGYFDFTLFQGIELQSIDGWTFPTLGPSWMNLLPPAQQQRNRIDASGDALYRSLYKLLQEQLGKKCRQDSWHVRTAEVHGMLCFLTTDSKLLSAVKSLRNRQPLKAMTTMVMSPAELGTYLGLRPVAPHVLSYNNASWIVRTDETMPGERRRKANEYGTAK